MSVSDVTALIPVETHTHKCYIYTHVLYPHTQRAVIEQTCADTNPQTLNKYTPSASSNNIQINNIGVTLTLLLQKEQTQCCPHACEYNE